jgi:hypothetical protein
VTEVTGPVVALAGAYGVFLIYTAVVFDWRGLRVGPPVAGRPARRDRIGDWLAQAGLAGSKPAELVAVSALLAAIAGSLCWAVFGGAVPAVIVAGFAATVPLASARARRDRRRAEAREAWPRLIEELRLQATSAGRSVPQALFAVGARAPAEMQPAFEAAYRDWLLTTDFARTVDIHRKPGYDPVELFLDPALRAPKLWSNPAAVIHPARKPAARRFARPTLNRVTALASTGRLCAHPGPESARGRPLDAGLQFCVRCAAAATSTAADPTFFTEAGRRNTAGARPLRSPQHR